MTIHDEVKESAATERQHQKQREAAIYARAKAETQGDDGGGDRLSESARQDNTRQRQRDNNRQASMQKRAQGNS